RGPRGGQRGRGRPEPSRGAAPGHAAPARADRVGAPQGFHHGRRGWTLMSRMLEPQPRAATPQAIGALDTPVLIVDLDRLDDNIARWAAFAREAGVKLRPHGKTHKCVEIARRQIEAGAVGLTLAKIGEAEVMAQAGVGDIFLAYEVIGAPKLPRLI